MQRFVASVMILSVLTATLPAQEGKKVALLVGVQDYTGTGLNNLKYAEKDVTDLGTALTGIGYKVTLVTKSAYKRQDLAFLDPTATNIRAQIKAITRDRTAADTVVVALSGHGIHLKATNKFYYCPVACDLEKPETMITVDDIMAALGECKAGSKVLLVDACRNDPTDGKAATDGRLESLTRPLIPEPPGGTVALFSCSKGQISQESETFEHGFMMHFVIDGLKGKAANAKTGIISWDKLVAHVKDEVPEAVATQKGPSIQQRPESFGKSTILTLGKVGAGNITEERSIEIAPGVKMIFCRVPEGTCQLGSPKAERQAVMLKEELTTEPAFLKAEAEEKRGKFNTNGFWLGKFTVTQEEWTAVMGSNPSWWTKTKGTNGKGLGVDTSRFPVENVSWDDAHAFLRKVNARGGIDKVFGKTGRFTLPDEDQWEYACRGGLGNKQPYYWGDSLNGDKANCYGQMPFGTAQMGNVLERTDHVGSYAKQAPHPWGLCDMAGNVNQWCESWYDVDHKHRVLRGGGWQEPASFCRSARRGLELPNSRMSTNGFRVCLVLE